MNDDRDDLDRALQGAGSRWRDGQRPAPGVDLASLTNPTPARWVAPVAAAAAVAMIVGGGAVLLGADDDDAAPGPGATATDTSDVPAIVVPWADLPAAHEEIPEPAQVWDPAPDYAAGAPTCTSEQVALVPGFQMDEGVSPYAEISVNAKPGERCAMPTNAELVFLDGARSAEVVAEVSAYVGGWPGDAVLLQGEGTGYVHASWDRDSCVRSEGRGRAEILELRWDGGAVDVPIPEKFGQGPEGDLEPQSQPACLSDDLELGMERLTTLGAGEVTPPGAYDTLQIEQVGHEPAGDDGLETWLIELTATEQDLELGDCPDARITHSYTYDGGYLRDEKHRYRMNCDWSGLPHDSQGDPVLPVGQPVVFTVKAPTPAPRAGESYFETTWALLGATPTGIVLERTLDQTQGPELPAIVPEEEANYHLQISNQSFANEEVPIRIVIDGDVLIDDVFAVEGQHSWTDYGLALAPGEHRLEAVSDDGGRFSTTLSVSAEQDTFGQLLFWQEEGAEPEFTWTEQDHGFVWD